MTTLEEAQDFVSKNLESGVVCPCCDQFAKLYRRKLNSAQAYALLVVYKYFRQNLDQDWVHVRQFNYSAFRGGDFAKLRYWGLIRPKANDDDTKKDSGVWQLTSLGMQFAEGIVKVDSHIGVYNKTTCPVDCEKISIQEALGNKFDYKELMA